MKGALRYILDKVFYDVLSFVTYKVPTRSQPNVYHSILLSSHKI